MKEYSPYDHNFEYNDIMLYVDTEYQPKQKGDLETQPLCEGWDINDVYATIPLNSPVVQNPDGTDNLYSVYYILLKPNEAFPEKAQTIRDITRMTINKFSNEDQKLLFEIIDRMKEFHDLLEKDIKEYSEQIKADYLIDQQMWRAKHDYYGF